LTNFQDTEAVAGQLEKESGGRIKTGVYHADIAAAEKERLHEAWRHGIIKVVCATIGSWCCVIGVSFLISFLAFGMGIDKGDVRFVLHHSVSPFNSLTDLCSNGK
jgi:ATP-dependent DNA helicase Q1